MFTYLFIYEMGTKLLALGVQKYVADKMNWLDGGVVLLSIFEIIYQKMQEGKGVSLSAFKTMRLFRTFRVFRIARLLRALESMQMVRGPDELFEVGFAYDLPDARVTVEAVDDIGHPTELLVQFNASVDDPRFVWHHFWSRLLSHLMSQ